jgi:ABC-type multidrug transport system ATPase subunit
MGWRELMIKVKNLTFAYDKKRLVFNNLNLKIESRKITAILGHNGAGKTTIFKCILGLIKPRIGSVELKEDERLLKTNISYMPDSGGFYPLLSPYDNLLFRASFYNKTTEAKQLASYWVDKLILNRSKVKLAGQLSHGMQKRLSFACALINNPNIILLDEPTNGLDPESTDIIIKILGDLKKEDNTILINTHDLNLVRETCNKILFLQDGVIIDKKNVNEINDNLKDYYLNMVSNYVSNIGANYV